ncbi:hypothetical protein Xish_03353 [Xenorhabdus ishibashii]|uniref:Uncharacterized protein n=1 Tax=Xenorhabdus ishibashii TaxID=1034471 RepID=A0A2D0K9T4_9GAMM|nr:hypothetical protein Xish_03353 [Xenorhabdus ishibashii]
MFEEYFDVKTELILMDWLLNDLFLSFFSYNILNCKQKNNLKNATKTLK